MPSPTLGAISECFFSPSQRKINRSANMDYSHLMLPAAEAFTGSSAHQTDFFTCAFILLWCFMRCYKLYYGDRSAYYYFQCVLWEHWVHTGASSASWAAFPWMCSILPRPGGRTSPAEPHTPGRKGALAAPEQFHCEMKGCTGHTSSAKVILC